MPFIAAKFAWLLTSILIVLTAGLLLTAIYMPTAPPGIRLAFLVFSIIFPAVITGLYMGQVTFLVFWGLVACLFLIKKEQWFWAGAALILTTVKPHMVVLPVLYLLVYMARRRKFQGWAGLAVAGFVCLAILLLLSPDLADNLIGETAVASGHWATSTIGGVLSYLGVTEAARYLILLLLPLPFLLAKYSDRFSIEFSVALLTLITVPTTIYGWSYDQTILLIPIAQVFSWLTRSKNKLAISALIVCVMALNYFQRVLPLNEVYYVWVPLVWWFIFGITWRNTSPPAKSLA
jgi:Glycosyltransferase family 87